MTRDVQLEEPAAELLRVAGVKTAGWLRRVMVHAARRGGVDPADISAEIDDLVDATTLRLLDELGALLARDVDDQRSNPLSIYRASVGPANELLARCGVNPPPDDAFGAVAFPHDRYRLGPASWSDIDDAMHDPGIRWGAWKAMTVLQRRRDEGRR